MFIMSDFMEYSSKTQSNIILKEDFEKLTQQVFNIIASNLSKSLGPLGSSAMILDGTMTESTKDGYAILMSYDFRNRYKKMIYNLIKTPCTKMNNIVGDGTTTAIVLTNAIFNRWKISKNLLETLYRLPRTFNKAWDEVISEICEKIQNKSRPIDPEDYDTIYNIAYVTSNGNEEISRDIARVYKEAKAPNIKQKDSPTNKSYIDNIEGFEFPTNFLKEIYVRNQDKTSSENDIAVILFNFKIETDFFDKIVLINEAFRAMNKKLLIVAPSYDKVLLDTSIDGYLRFELQKYGNINLILSKFSLKNIEDTDINDFAVVLRGRVIDQDLANILVDEIDSVGADKVIDNSFNDIESKTYRFIGTAKHAMLTLNSGSIFYVPDVKDDEEYKTALKIAEQNLEEIISNTNAERQSYSAKIHEARTRVMQLRMNNYIYYVGADSDLQKKILWDAIEDVIKCLRSAIKYGVVPGCQLSIVSSCSEMIAEIFKKNRLDSDGTNMLPSYDRLKVEILNIISSAVTDVYAQVLHGPDGMGIVKTIPGWYKSPSKIDYKNVPDDIKELALSRMTTDELEVLRSKVEVEEVDTETLDRVINKFANAINDVTIQMEAINKSTDIITKSIELYKTFNLETLKFSDDIITSAETDKMVLIAASELVKILISGNQCIFIDADLNGCHEESREVYV